MILFLVTTTEKQGWKGIFNIFGLYKSLKNAREQRDRLQKTGKYFDVNITPLEIEDEEEELR